MFRLILSFVGVVAVLLVACGGDDAPEPTPTASLPTRIPFPTSAPVPTATATAVPTPRPGADTAPQGTQTGDAGIDAVLGAILAKDEATLSRLFAPFAVPCTTTQGLGGPPKCEYVPGKPPEGTLVTVLATGGCEGGWAFDMQELASDVVGLAPELFAVIQAGATKPLYDEPGYPIVDHMIVAEFRPNPGQRFAIRFSLARGRIVAMNSGCGQQPENLNLNRDLEAYEVILRGPAYR
jgi:hypothetical protein